MTLDSLTLLRALGRLTMNQREAFIDSVVLHRRQADIAETMGISKQRVGELVRDARVHLERRLTVYRDAA